jgi:hypothetical protein
MPTAIKNFNNFSKGNTPIPLKGRVGERNGRNCRREGKGRYGKERRERRGKEAREEEIHAREKDGLSRAAKTKRWPP